MSLEEASSLLAALLFWSLLAALYLVLQWMPASS